MALSDFPPIFAYFESSHDFPEELLAAAGYTPYKVLGTKSKSTLAADRYLPNFVCPLSRAIFSEALENLKHWHGAVITHGCDATNRQYDLWRQHADIPFLHWLYNPLKNDPNAQAFFKQEIEAFQTNLQSQLGISIDTEDLKRVIAQANAIKSILRAMAALRTQKDIPNRDYFGALIRCVQEPREEVIVWLKEMLHDWENHPPFPKEFKRIILTGGDLDSLQLADLLDDARLRVVRDDLSIGERYFTRTFQEDLDPIAALVDYYLFTPRPATKLSLGDRLAFLGQMATHSSVDGIVSQNLRFCEPYAYDAVTLREYFQARNIPVLHFERDLIIGQNAQLFTRLEAFKEML